MKKQTIVKALAVGAVAAVASTPTFAAIDLSTVTDSITADGTSAITTIGTAMIGLAGVAIVFKWAKAAIFG